MKDIHDLASDLQSKLNLSIDKLSGLGAIDAAMKASQLANLSIPKYDSIASLAGRFKELDRKIHRALYACHCPDIDLRNNRDAIDHYK